MDTPPPSGFPPPPPPQQGGFPLPPPPPKTGKSGCLKAFLIALAVLVVLGGGCVAAAAWWWSSNGEEFMARGQAVTTEGEQAGRGTDEAGCVQLAKRRAAADASLTSMVGHGIYTSACLGAARETPGFCEAVPPEGEFRAVQAWTRQQCPGGDAGCSIVAQSTVQYCTRERPQRRFDPQPVPAPANAGAAADSGAASF